jgi:hypothetical protein
MAKFFDRKVILQKIETVEGTDAAPVVATDAIQTRNYAPNLFQMDVKVRNLDIPFFGARPEIPTNLRRGAVFEIEMAGGGAAITIPPWMKVNRIAGFDPGVAGASSVVQTPISAAIPSATHYAWIDNLLTPTIGARASMGIRVVDQDFPFFTYTVLGRAPPVLHTESAPGVPVVTPFQTPVLANSANTTFMLDGFALPLRSLNLDNNNALIYRTLIGPPDKVIWTNRRWAGTIVAELPDLTAKNYFSYVPIGTTMALQLIHGTVAGNIVQIDAPKVQIVGYQLPNENGIVMIQLDVILQANAGNDEILITSK